MISLLTLAVATVSLAAPGLRRPAHTHSLAPGRRRAADDRRRRRAADDRGRRQGRVAAGAGVSARARELAAAAGRAAEDARLSREAWERAQVAVDETWAAFDAAESESRRLAAAARFPVF